MTDSGLIEDRLRRTFDAVADRAVVRPPLNRRPGAGPASVSSTVR